MKRYAAALLLFLPVLCPADPVNDSLDRIHSAYERGELRHCLTELEGAVRLVREKLVEKIGLCLPDAFGGWEPMNTSGGPAAMLSRALRVSRLYYNGDTGASIEIQISFDRSRAAVLRSWIANPLDFRRDNQKAELLNIASNRFIVSYDEHDRHGELKTALSGSAALELIGDGLAGADDLIDFAEKLDIEKLEAAFH